MIGTLIVAATRLVVGGQGVWIGCGPSNRQRIYFANHSSHLDTILVWAAMPVPVFLDNLRRALPKGSLVPVPLSCIARFGAPIRLEEGEAKPDFLNCAREAVVALA